METGLAVGPLGHPDCRMQKVQCEEFDHAGSYIRMRKQFDRKIMFVMQPDKHTEYRQLVAHEVYTS